MYKHAVETRAHKLNFNQVDILATETWENLRQIMKAIPKKFNKKSIIRAREFLRCYQGILDKTNPVGAIIKRQLVLE